MKVLLVLAVALSLVVGCAACASSKKGAASGASGASTTTGSNSGTRTGAVPVTTGSATTGRPKGDEDDDDESGENIGPTSKDDDADQDNDHKPPTGRYYDADDRAVRAFGHAPSAADRRALTSLARRYYAAAAAEDGGAACSMLTSVFVKAVPEDYGHESAGPAYLSAGRTCPAVLALLFKHFHAELSVSIKVMGVRVEGGQGLVLIGSPAMPASVLFAQREAGAWRLIGMLASALP